jgi:hypothetical protein
LPSCVHLTVGFQDAIASSQKLLVTHLGAAGA